MEKSNFNILIVDDEEGIVDSLRMNFELEDYNVLVAHSGQEGVQIFLNNKVDFIISDVRMKNGDGIFFLEEVRKTHPELPPFVLFSGFTELSKDEAIKKGALDLLSKPLDLSKIESYVEKHFSSLIAS